MTHLLSTVVLLASQSLSGEWEVQSLGADRAMLVQHEGAAIKAHRVMWPEFNGSRYKLEHLYRGRIAAGKISGQLLVKEDELPAFEPLRPFVGSLEADGTLIIDGFRLARKSARVRVIEAVETPRRVGEIPGS